MTFSIIVPVHNGEKYIDDMMDPIIAQLDQDIDLEVLLVENGSTDNSPKICDEYARSYPFIKAFHYGPIGAYSARREGIKNAKGQWLIFVDVDDCLTGAALSKIERAIVQNRKNARELDMVLYNAAYLDDKEKRKFSFPLEEGKIYKGDDKRIFYEIMCKNDSLNALWNKCITRELALSAISVNEQDNLNHGEDLLQTAAFIDKAKEIVYVDEILYYYRRNNEGLTAGYHPDYITHQERAWEAFADYSEKWVGDCFNSYINARKSLTCTIAVINIIYSNVPLSEIKEKLKWLMDQKFYNEFAELDLPAWAPEEDVYVHKLQKASDPYLRLMMSATKRRLKTRIKRILKHGL